MLFLLEESFHFVQKFKYALEHLTAGKPAHFGVIHKTSVFTIHFLTQLLEKAMLKQARADIIHYLYYFIHHLLEARKEEFYCQSVPMQNAVSKSDIWTLFLD